MKVSEKRPAHQCSKVPKSRRHIVDSLGCFAVAHPVHGLFEADITKARHMIRQLRSANNTKVSIVDYLLYCLSRAIDENKSVHGVIGRNGKLYVFDDVDMLVIVENLDHGTRYPAAYVIRSANKKSFREINREMCSFRAENHGRIAYGNRAFRLFSRFVPRFFRKLVYRYVNKKPFWRKKNMGTVCVSAVGVHSKGSGWAIPSPVHPLFLTIGGLSKREVLVNGELQLRCFIGLTISFDHLVSDGAPAARFTSRFRQIIENAEGLSF